jgi:hypothetical protein
MPATFSRGEVSSRVSGLYQGHQPPVEGRRERRLLDLSPEHVFEKQVEETQQAKQREPSCPYRKVSCSHSYGDDREEDDINRGCDGLVVPEKLEKR